MGATNKHGAPASNSLPSMEHQQWMKAASEQLESLMHSAKSKTQNKTPTLFMDSMIGNRLILKTLRQLKDPVIFPAFNCWQFPQWTRDGSPNRSTYKDGKEGGSSEIIFQKKGKL